MQLTDLALKLRTDRRIKGQRLSYQIEEPIGRGGSGIVYRGQCVETTLPVAIKFFLPLRDLNLGLFESSMTQQQTLKDLEAFHQRELECLRELRHPSIVQVLDHGVFRPSRSELIPPLQSVEQINFFVMDFIAGTTIDHFVRREGIAKHQLVSILLALSAGLIYLHEVKEYLHADIRAANILIRATTLEPVIIDFALYKNLNFAEVTPTETTKLFGDWDLFPKDIHTEHPLKKLKETRGSRAELKELCFPGLDLFQLGKLLLSLKNPLAQHFAPDEMQFLSLIIDELTTWDKVRHRNARWLRDQFGKLDSSYSQFMGVEELVPASSAKRKLQLPSKVVATSELIDGLSNTRSFQRLTSINQLAFIRLLYPGAGYQRALHCFRAYGYCSDLIESLVQAPHFRLLFTPELARQALAVALVHDINHFPLLHTFQEARGEYIRNLDLLDLFCDGKATQDSPSIYDLLERIGLDRQSFKDLLFLSHDQISERYGPGIQIIKSIIDSGADIDKLAYLEDDSRFTGVAYGRGVDAPRLIASSTIVRTPGGGWHIGFREEGLSAVESLVMARYWMFRTVYWHRLNRAVMAMLIHVIQRLYVDGGANAADFIIDTMGRAEDFVIRYINDKFKARFGRESIAPLILEGRTAIYRRLVSLSGVAPQYREESLYSAITELDAKRLEQCRANLRTALEDFFGTLLQKRIALDEDDVIFDIPGRRADKTGSIYIQTEAGEVKSLEDIPGPVRAVLPEFEKLAKRLRIFINPRAMMDIAEEKLVACRPEIIRVVEQSVPQGAAVQIR